MALRPEMPIRVAVFVLCLFLWNLTAHARILLQQDPGLDALCGELRNEDPVQVFATPVNEIVVGTIVDTCQGSDWMLGFLRGTSGTDAIIECDDDDIQFMAVSNSIPASGSTCDVTQQFPQPDFTVPDPDDPPIAGGPICMPPPMFCSTNSSDRRRRMQGLSRSRATATSRSSGRNGDFALSVDVQETSTSGSSSASASSAIVQGGAQGGVQTSLSVSSSSMSGGTSASMSVTSTGPAAGVTVCKAQCCVTAVVGGAMYGRLYDLVSNLSCQGFPDPS